MIDYQDYSAMRRIIEGALPSIEIGKQRAKEFLLQKYGLDSAVANVAVADIRSRALWTV